VEAGTVVLTEEDSSLIRVEGLASSAEGGVGLVAGVAGVAAIKVGRQAVDACLEGEGEGVVRV
jgi:hypothetical protein